ncbi:MAG: MlaD family protein [Saprospiraceae bacterium]|nr:MlaD family protein [Saprospiraceae bacterium]
MSYEVRIGLLATICIAIAIWGYKFMKGKNILNASNNYYVEYRDVDELAATSPVMIRGMRVGTVEEIRLSDDMRSVIATLDIDRGIRFPASTEALIVSTSIMGGKAVVLNVTEACSDDCAKPGTFLSGRVQGVFESMFGEKDVENIRNNVRQIINTISDSLTSDQASSAVARSFQDMRLILSNLASITGQLSTSMAAYDRKLIGVLSNLEETTAMLSARNEDIAATLTNLRDLSQEFRDAGIGEKAGDVMASASDVVDQLDAAIAKAENTFNELNALMSGINEGEGTLGLLAKDAQLYEELSSTLRNLDLLLQDFRLNPKRYVNVSVFGKKQKTYRLPENDPADTLKRRQ